MSFDRSFDFNRQCSQFNRQCSQFDRQCSRQLWLAFIAGLLIALRGTAPLDAGETFSVRLRSGRSFQGQADPRTDDRQLWLRGGRTHIAVVRPIAWDRIEIALADGRTMPADEFREHVLGAVRYAAHETETAQNEIPGNSDAPETIDGPPAAVSPPAVWLQDETWLPCDAPRVHSIHVEAWIANWDSDVEADGLVVQLFPLSADGLLTPVTGTLEVDLEGFRFQPARTRLSFPQIGRWTTRVQSADIGSAGASYRFAFQAAHPEFDLSLAPHGVVHARLTAPGHGTFDDSAGTVRIRPFSYLRDQRELRSGGRFFPSERTGRNQ